VQGFVAFITGGGVKFMIKNGDLPCCFSCVLDLVLRCGNRALARTAGAHVSRMPSRYHICWLLAVTASKSEIPHLSTIAMGATATSPRWFCTNDGEYSRTPSRGVLFSKRDAAASGPDGGRADMWRNADRTASMEFFSEHAICDIHHVHDIHPVYLKTGRNISG